MKKRPIGASVRPEQIQRASLFNYIETELKALETELPCTKGK